MLTFGDLILAHLIGDYILQDDWMAANKRKSHLACLAHVTLYMLSIVCVAQLSGPGGLPLWAYAFTAATHYAIDRYGLARRWMSLVHQDGFATNLGPWSVIIVDNTIHLFLLWAVFKIHELGVFT